MMNSLHWHSIGLLLVGCGGKVDLGSSSGWANTRGTAAASAAQSNSETPAPVAQTLYDGRNTVQAIAVDETTIAALIGDVAKPTAQLDACRSEDCRATAQIVDMSSGDAEAMAEPIVRLDICRFEDCRGTAQTIDSFFGDPADSPGSTRQLLISHGEVFWVRYSVGAPPTISACPTAGCPEGPRELVRVSGLNAFAADADYLYWFDTTFGTRMLMARCARAGCDTPETMPLTGSWAQIVQVGVDSNNRLVIDDAHRFLFLSGSHGIIRVPTDFSTAPEILYEDPSNLDGLAVIGDHVYFARSTLPGEILRCPIWGCGAGPEQVVSAPRWPSRLAADDRAIFWMNSAESNTTNPGSGTEEGDSDAAAISATRLDGMGGANPLVARFRSSTLFSSCAGPIINSHHLYWCEVTGAAGSPISLNIRTLHR